MSERAAVPSIASGAIRRLFETLRESGIDPVPIAAEAGVEVDVGADPDRRVPLEALHTLWESALRRAPRTDGALLGATRYRPGDYGLVGFVCMNSATLGEALGHAVRYVHLWTDDPTLRLDNGTVYLRYRTSFPDRLGVRCATEATLAELVHGARLVTGSQVGPAEVWFAHPGPHDRSEHEAFFGCPVRFRAGSTGMRFQPETLTTPLPFADAQLGAFLRKLANEALARQTGRDASPLDQVRELVAEELQRGVPSLGAIARRLAVSERTLRRRLQDEGTSFRALLEETRAQLARAYVIDRRLPLSEVAFLLGFSEPSAFHRAFKRWTGETPAVHRARSGQL
jgi:AraC-like DNA-binding protein